MNNTFKLLGIATSIAVAITSCGSSGTDNQQASTPAADTARLAPVETKAPNSTYKPAFEGQTRIGGVKTTTPYEGKILSERSEEHTSELQSLMRISYAVFCLKKK